MERVCQLVPRSLPVFPYRNFGIVVVPALGGAVGPRRPGVGHLRQGAAGGRRRSGPPGLGGGGQPDERRHGPRGQLLQQLPRAVEPPLPAGHRPLPALPAGGRGLPGRAGRGPAAGPLQQVPGVAHRPQQPAHAALQGRPRQGELPAGSTQPRKAPPSGGWIRVWSSTGVCRASS